MYLLYLQEGSAMMQLRRGSQLCGRDPKMETCLIGGEYACGVRPHRMPAIARILRSASDQPALSAPEFFVAGAAVAALKTLRSRAGLETGGGWEEWRN